MQAQRDQSPYRTVKETAAYFRVSTRTVSRWIEGGLVKTNVGGESRPDWRIRIEDVERFLAQRERKRGDRDDTPDA